MQIIIIYKYMYFIEFAFILVWVGALGTYLASDHQKLLISPLSKNICWLSLAACLILSTYLFSMVFAVVASLLFSIAILLVSWLCIIFIAGHWRVKLPTLAFSGVITVFLLAQMVGA